MNSNITEQYLNISYCNFSNENQKLLNDINNCSDEKRIKQYHKELQIIHSIEINILKLRSLRKSFEEKNKNL